MRNGTATTDAIEKLAIDAAKLRKDLTDAISFIPGYDQRQCENVSRAICMIASARRADAYSSQKLKDIEAQIEALRVTAAPKSKFAFKRKAAKPSSSVMAPVAPPKQIIAGESTATPPQDNSHSSGLSLSGHTHGYLTVSSLSAPWSAASDLTISDLDHCVVNLVPSRANPDAPADLAFNALHVRNVTNSVLILPVIPGSALLHDMKNCVIALGSRQVAQLVPLCGTWMI